MRFRKVNRSEADYVQINVRNISGATLSRGAAVEWDVVTATDGNSVTACKSASKAGLFAGILDEALADSAYGMCQVYGYFNSAYVSRASAGDVPGQFLLPTTGYLDSGQTMSAMTTSGMTFVTLLETITASAAYSSAAQLYQHAVFIRSM